MSAHLKKLEKSFGKLFDYFACLQEIKEARKEIKKKKVISQEELFKKLDVGHSNVESGICVW